jgi:hypothetical protein
VIEDAVLKAPALHRPAAPPMRMDEFIEAMARDAGKSPNSPMKPSHVRVFVRSTTEQASS